ncbi:hypothetical protein QN379_03630 [Glaciimonas sp. Gout2]|nr:MULTISPECIES: hypothetical protein [unclassified Glaciimonas]MDY7545078.1 hypothetical protein [Glaciimonas sp. CA11.2]MEB0011452.1 hypothetical protein [Glaciimonas sp. Cout2]MEB0081103.1 hypothetical protein [Glaciimonas sp. Gout2]
MTSGRLFAWLLDFDGVPDNLAAIVDAPGSDAKSLLRAGSD